MPGAEQRDQARQFSTWRSLEILRRETDREQRRPLRSSSAQPVEQLDRMLPRLVGEAAPEAEAQEMGYSDHHHHRRIGPHEGRCGATETGPRIGASMEGSGHNLLSLRNHFSPQGSDQFGVKADTPIALATASSRSLSHIGSAPAHPTRLQDREALQEGRCQPSGEFQGTRAH